MSASLRPLRSLLAMLRAPHLRAGFADLLTGASVDGSSSAGEPDRFAPFVSGGIAERHGDGVRLHPDFVETALAAVDASLSPRAVLDGDRIALADVAPSDIDETVAAVARRVLIGDERVTERTLNDRLSLFVEDVAFFRRHAVDIGVLEREPDGSAYWRADAAASASASS